MFCLHDALHAYQVHLCAITGGGGGGGGGQGQGHVFHLLAIWVLFRRREGFKLQA